MMIIGVLAGLIGAGIVAFVAFAVVFYVQRNKVQQRSNPVVIELGSVVSIAVPVQDGEQKNNGDFGASQRKSFVPSVPLVDEAAINMMTNPSLNAATPYDETTARATESMPTKPRSNRTIIFAKIIFIVAIFIMVVLAIVESVG